MAYKGGYIVGFFNPPEKTSQQKNAILLNGITIQYRNML